MFALRVTSILILEQRWGSIGWCSVNDDGGEIRPFGILYAGKCNEGNGVSWQLAAKSEWALAVVEKSQQVDTRWMFRL